MDHVVLVDFQKLVQRFVSDVAVAEFVVVDGFVRVHACLPSGFVGGFVFHEQVAEAAAAAHREAVPDVDVGLRKRQIHERFKVGKGKFDILHNFIGFAAHVGEGVDGDYGKLGASNRRNEVYREVAAVDDVAV